MRNAKALRCGRVVDNSRMTSFRLADMVEPLHHTLDAWTPVIAPVARSTPGTARLGDPRRRGRPQQARIRGALAAVLALSATSEGLTVAEITAKVHR